MSDPEVTYLHLVQCSVCGLMMTPRGYDGDGRPFVREQCPDCGAALDALMPPRWFVSFAGRINPWWLRCAMGYEMLWAIGMAEESSGSQ